MIRKCLILASLAAASGTTSAQVQLYGVDFPGNLYTVDTNTGMATFFAATGFDRYNSAAIDASGFIYTSHARNTAVPGDGNKLIRIDSSTGVGVEIADYGTAGSIRGLAFTPAGVLYAIVDSTQDLLATVDPVTGAITSIGSTGITDLQGLTAGPGGQLYALGLSNSGTLYTLDQTTGAATLVSSGLGVGNDTQTIEWNGGNEFWLARANLHTVPLTGGTSTLVGALGVADIRGLAAVLPSVSCYANCDGSTTSPVLNVSDFGCFLSKFAAGDPYANCDGSTGAPQLNVADFGCFLTKFAAGCN